MVDRVVDAVRSGARTNQEIQVAVNGAVARSGYDPHLDRAIQKAKKAGRIVYRERQWFVADAPLPCPHCQGTGRVPPGQGGGK